MKDKIEIIFKINLKFAHLKKKISINNMAILQTIRNKYAKVAGGVIVLSLVGFVLMDATSGGGGGLFSPSTAVGSINGDDVDYNEYEEAVTLYENQYKQQSRKQSLDESESADLRDRTWNQLVNDKILEDVYQNIGIRVSEQELQDLLTGDNPDPMIVQSFTQQGQAFDPEFVADQIEQIKSNPETKGQWDLFINDLIKRREYAKFSSLVSGSVYTPKFILDNDANARLADANISYVQVPFSAIPDAEVKPTDDELNQYIQNHKSLFTIKQPSRTIEYVSFKVRANGNDSLKAFGEIEALKAEFGKDMNMDELVQFISYNSDISATPGYYTREQLNQLPNAEEIWNAPINAVVGPFNDGSGFVMSKTLSKSTLPDSVKVRHILVSTEQQRTPILADSLAKARIDSVQALVRSGANFDSLVVKYSNDQGSLDKGGVYDFTLASKPTISKEFGDFAFNGKVGESKIVKASNDQYSGYHYIEILDQKNPTTVAQVATIAKELNPSSEAFSEVFTKSSAFSAQAKDAASFEQAAKEMVLNTSIANNLNINSSVVQGVGASRDLVKWAYSAKVGEVSGVITIGDQYIVAILKDVQEKGLMKLNTDNRSYVESMVIKEKKAKLILEKNKANTSLEAISSANNIIVSQSDSVNFLQGFIPNVGGEPKVVGYIFGKETALNKLSPGIVGNAGVFYVNVASKYNLPAMERNVVMERKMADAQVKASIINIVINGLKDAYKVEDNRGKFF